MALESHQKTINGEIWELNELPATKGLEVFGDIMALIGDAASGFAAPAATPASPESILDVDLGKSGVVSLIGLMMKKIGDPKFIPTVKQLLYGGGHLARAGRPIAKSDFDDVFSANYGVLAQVVVFAFEANFASFLEGSPDLRALFGLVKSLGSKPSTSAASTGSSSELS
jgi:hypothetical protein